MNAFREVSLFDVLGNGFENGSWQAEANIRDRNQQQTGMNAIGWHDMKPVKANASRQSPTKLVRYETGKDKREPADVTTQPENDTPHIGIGN